MDPFVTPMLVSAGMSGLGALMGHLGKSKSAKTTQLQQLTPEQQQAQSQALQMSLQGMQDPGAGFDPIAKQAMSQFKSDIIPGLAERFTSMGGGAQRSSAFQGALGRAGAGLAGDLAAQRSQYGLQRMSGLQNLLGMGLGRRYENVFQPEQTGTTQALGGQLFGAGMSSLGQSLQGMQAQQGIDARATQASDLQGWQDKRDEKQREWQKSMYERFPNYRG